MSIDIVRDHKDLDKYFYVSYEVEGSKSVFDVAWGIAVGQSIGNPSTRSVWETEEMIEAHCAKIIRNDNFNEKSGIVEIGYPNINMDWDTDGISHLLCMIMGGQTDIDSIKRCRVVGLEIHPDIISTHFHKPRYGITGMRQLTNTPVKPFFGGIIKPKTGITPHQLLDMVKELVDGGVNFIKEDEILSNPAINRLEDRVPLIADYIKGKNVVYTFCINADPLYSVDRARFVAEHSDDTGLGIHINFWSGFGVYKSIRDLDLPLFIHYQKSGDKVITHPNNPFGISWHVLCQLASLCGVDTIHSGMYGGYLSDTEEDIRETFRILHGNNLVPALSCGMTAELIPPIVEKFGTDWMANVGGAIHGHAEGTLAGARKIRKAIDSL
jgi:ribulose 1,5-bisphosphate carboxylase large subunit-like protein